MTTDEKILNALEALKTDVTTMKSEIGKIPAVEKQLSQQGKILTVITANVGTILSEYTKFILQKLATKSSLKIHWL
jgi:hypothetical protein